MHVRDLPFTDQRSIEIWNHLRPYLLQCLVMQRTFGAQKPWVQFLQHTNSALTLTQVQ